MFAFSNPCHLNLMLLHAWLTAIVSPPRRKEEKKKARWHQQRAARGKQPTALPRTRRGAKPVCQWWAWMQMQTMEIQCL